VNQLNNVFYRFCRAVVVGFCRLYFRVTVEGLENVPARGPFVLAPVHRSNVDFAIAAVVTKRRLGYMAKDSLWKVPVLRNLIDALGGYPVHRGSADREAMRRTMAVIEAGTPVVIFPEGTRRSGPMVQELFEGAAYIASRAGVPIVPVGIGGSERAMPKGSKMLRPVKVHVVVGEPFVIDRPEGSTRVPRRAVHQLTEQLHAELQKLFDQAQVRAGA
jgi:1-acyl-sn-glycerol-3-phosphate acyltransferase